jgi:hypothetical protein
MPGPESIVGGLAAISSRYWGAAVAWHVVLATLLGGVVAGWRPAQQTLGMVITALLTSVSAFAFVAGNVFNGVVFLLLAGLAVKMTLRLPKGSVKLASAGAVAAGVALALFGWVYPHFVEGLSFLYRAPTGLLPCPTLSLIIGLCLAVEDRSSRRWLGTLAGAGLFYGLFGMLALAVKIDFVLVLGAAALIVAAARVSHPAAATPA